MRNINFQGCPELEYKCCKYEILCQYKDNAIPGYFIVFFFHCDTKKYSVIKRPALTIP